MAKWFKFVVPGKPKVLKRHRQGRWGNNYDPSAKDKKVIAQYCLESMQTHGIGLFRGDCRVQVDCYGLRSNSDVSNALKLVEDALNKVAYNDDKQISHAIVRRCEFEKDKPKVYRTEVAVWELREEEL